MQKIETHILELFKGVKIVTLKELTLKVAMISKVRVRDEKNRTAKVYQEISLTDMDEYGIIHPPKPLRELSPANERVLDKQALQEGDLVLYHRAKSLSVGLFDGSYGEYPIVGNNSMIRIQFDYNRKKNTPIYIQCYLQLPFIAEYLYSLTNNEGADQRRILSSAQLLELPIPYFEEENNPYALREFYYKRVDICSQVNVLQEQIARMQQRCALINQETLCDYMSAEDLLPYLERDDRMLEKLHEISEELEKCEKVFE